MIKDQPQTLEDMLVLHGYTVHADKGVDVPVQELFAGHLPFDMIILDLDMPRLDGWQILKAIRVTPETAELPVIILSETDAEDLIIKGLHRGADAYLVKPVNPKRLLAQIKALTRRNPKSGAAPTGSGDGKGTQVASLTPRENEILRLLIKGYSNQQIAAQLIISETTVKNHLAHIFKKLGVSNRTQAAYLARQWQM